MKARILTFLESRKDKTKFWTVGGLKKQLGLENPRGSLGSTLFSLTREGFLLRTDGIGPRGGYGYRARPDNWPGAKQLCEDVAKFLLRSPGANVREVSMAVSGRYVHPPCDLVLEALIEHMFAEGQLELAVEQRKGATFFASTADLRLAFDQWMLTLGRAPVA